MYAILGATGNVGSVIANGLLAKGEKVRVVGRDSNRLDKFVRRGAEAVTANVQDATALTQALVGVRAAFLMIPPNVKSQDYRADQEVASDAIVSAVRQADLRYAVFLSSIGAHVPAGTGPIAGLHSAEEKLNAVGGVNVLHLRPAYFMENNLAGMGMIHAMGVLGNALRAELKIAMIATRDIGDYAARRIYSLDFSGKETQELLGERDLSMNETAAIIARGIGKPDLRYVQFPYEQVQQVLVQMGIPVKTAALFIEMYKAFNEDVVAAQEPRSAENTTPTPLEKFVQEVFAPAYQGRAATA
jgi:uncharacterized protein YbjT (DUF2867 family)